MFTSFSYSDQQKDIIDVKQTAGANLKLVKNVWVHPSSTQRQLWNTWITLCLVYNGIVIPVRIAFDLIEDPAAFIFDRFIDGSFIRKLRSLCIYAHIHKFSAL